MTAKRTLGVLLAVVLLSGAARASEPINISVPDMPLGLEPAKIKDAMGAWVVYLLGERLIDSRRSGGLAGDLAKSWAISPDGKTYTFVLREDAKFWDGSPVRAADIVRCLKDVQKNAGKGYASFYIDAVDAIRSDGPHELRITLKNRMNGFLSVLGEPLFSVWKQCDGRLCFSGGFTIVSSTEDRLSLLRTSDQQIFNLVSVDFAKAPGLFKAGKIDILKGSGLFHAPEVRAASAERLVFNDERTYFIAFNTKSEAFSSAPTRLGVIERLKLRKVEALLQKYGVPMAASLASPSFSMGRSLLLDERGSSRPASIPLAERFHGQPIRVISLRTEELTALISTAFEGMPYRHSALSKKDFVERALKGDYDALALGYGTSLKDLNVFGTLFHSKSLHNWAKISDPGTDAVLARMWSEVSQQKRLQFVADLLQRNRENGWYVALAHSPLLFALNERLEFEGKIPSEDYSLPSSDLDLRRIKWRKP